ncbi:hypothetical protein BLNAU_21560 [Blattamonas nauphoetae]|uniref:Uncharacterized protein n=1 Tax=Blattamonas nauphoetae TaxID=2049346 RepID=A0ABQ9WVJ8_9EUKA|nr:hypothetical protein BLNAU_21560 [Blattamonas nauphoetae]
MTFQPTLAFFSQRVTTQRTRARFPSVQADDDDDEDSSLEDSCEESLDHSVRKPPHPSIGQQKQPEISAEQRRRQKWLKWANRIECVHLNDQSIYTLGNEGLICRICHSHRNHLKYSREEYIVRPARPTHVNSVLGHIHTETHARALSLWLIDLDRIRQAAEVQDDGWRAVHITNQLRAVNQICHRRSSVNDFKSLTNLLDSIVCPTSVSDSHKTNYIRFWELADTLDRFYERRLFSEITTLTPLSLTLDISTDITSISVLCVNLRFFQ